MDKKYEDFSRSIDSLKSARSNLTNRIVMYDYYVKGTVGGKIPSTYDNPSFARTSFDIMTREFKKNIAELAVYPIKCDTTAETITSDGISSFVSATLPEGVDSIEVEFFDAKYRNYMKLNTTQRNLIADIGGVVTKNLHYLLKKPEYSFISKLNTAISSYIEYGFTAIRVDEDSKNIINIVNFNPELTFFDFEIGKTSKIPTFILLGERTNDAEIRKKYPSFRGNGADEKSQLSRANVIWYYYYCEKDGGWTYFVYDDTHKETLSYKTKERQPTIFIANREVKAGDYGVGDGLSSLSTIIDINTTSEGIKRAVNINTNPPLIIDENAQASFTGAEGQLQDGIDVSAGAQTYVRQPNTNPARDAVSLAFGGNHIDIASLYQIMEGAKQELRQAFSADLFSPSNSSSEQTATEINTRTSQSLHRFKGKANNLYSDLLIPLIKGYVRLIIEVEFSEKGNLYRRILESNSFEDVGLLINELKERFAIKILSFGEQLRKDQDLQNSLQCVQVLLGIHQQSQQLDPEVANVTKKITITMLENLNKAIGV